MKYLICAVMVFIGVAQSHAQDVYTSSGKSGYHKKTTKKKKGYDPDKLIIGGGLNAGFGGGYANVGLSPIVGYRITDHFSAGVGLGYQYYQEPEYADPNNPYKVSYQKENIIYPNIWSRYFVYRNFFVDGSVEYDLISARYPGYDNMGNFTTLKTNVTNTALLLGAGIRQPLGGRVSAYFELIYDVLQGTYSPYPQGSPDIRIGFAAGF